MSKDLHPSRKKYTRFSSKQPFQFGMPNASSSLKQASDNSPLYFTRATSLLRRQVLSNAPAVTIKSDDFHFRVLKREFWSKTDFSQKHVLFLIPSDALGDCVGIALFLRAFLSRYPRSKPAILNSASASDVFATVADVKIYQLFISSKELAKFSHIIDLSEMEGWDNVAQMPVNTEEALCEAFDIAPIPIPNRSRKIGRGATVGIVPMASAPLRTLPPETVNKLVRQLLESGYRVNVLLNAYQGLMPPYKAAINPSECGEAVFLDGFQTVGELVEHVKKQDYMILADSGPAHITKLFQTPGLAIYTSASGKTLQGRHQNLKIWQSTYTGDWCNAPCGLAKLRATNEGKVGCMGSLELPIEALPAFPSIRNKGLAEHFTLKSPVPCVQQLSSDLSGILNLLAEDIH